MNLAIAVVRAELDCRYYPDAEEISFGCGFREAVKAVVIGKGDCRKSGAVSGMDNLGWQEQAIRGRRMHVKIDFVRRRAAGA